MISSRVNLQCVPGFSFLSTNIAGVTTVQVDLTVSSHQGWVGHSFGAVEAAPSSVRHSLHHWVQHLIQICIRFGVRRVVLEFRYFAKKEQKWCACGYELEYRFLGALILVSWNNTDLKTHDVTSVTMFIGRKHVLYRRIWLIHSPGWLNLVTMKPGIVLSEANPGLWLPSTKVARMYHVKVGLDVPHNWLLVWGSLFTALALEPHPNLFFIQPLYHWLQKIVEV